ncbi:MAG: class I SAM-dependent methyltransferase [Candidatus Thorarchaeota archaeon]
MVNLREYFDANKQMWDKFAKDHYSSETYKTKEFLEGKTTLNSIELEELGDVKRKTLLHLQCHFGLDTLSWAREGAIVTGVDFSGEAINLARGLAEATTIDASFIQSNVYSLPDVLDSKFDIVFTSYGVHCWLNDLERWARIVSHFLKPGGTFYIAEFHPLLWMFDWDATDDFKLKRSYFHSEEPHEFDVDGSYGSSQIEPQKDYEWAHGMGKVISAIVSAGLQIEFMHEFPKSPFQQFPFLKQKDDGYWYYENPDVQLPLVYSIRASNAL